MKHQQNTKETAQLSISQDIQSILNLNNTEIQIQFTQVIMKRNLRNSKTKQVVMSLQKPIKNIATKATKEQI